MVCSTLTACTAEIFTLPFSTLKVKLQLQGNSLPHSQIRLSDLQQAECPRTCRPSVSHNQKGRSSEVMGRTDSWFPDPLHLSSSLARIVRLRKKELTQIRGWVHRISQNSQGSPTFKTRVISSFLCTSLAVFVSNPLVLFV